MQIESSKLVVGILLPNLIYISIAFLALVSHTTDELVFIWDPSIPLDVDKGIELPQLELTSTTNEDCTTEYSTGTS